MGLKLGLVLVLGHWVTGMMFFEGSYQVSGELSGQNVLPSQVIVRDLSSPNAHIRQRNLAY